MLSDRTQTQDVGGWGFVTIPAAAAAPLVVPARGIVVTGAGNLFVELADGSINPAAIAVTPSPYPIPYAVRRLAAGNTATIIGIL